MNDKREKQKYPEPTAGALIFNPEGKILLISGRKFNNTYVIPGGHIELGEKIEDALKREVMEETGLEIYDIKLAGLQETIFDPDYHEKRHFIYIDFTCRTDTVDVVLNHESESFVWTPISKAFSLPLHPTARKFLTEYIKGKKSPYHTSILHNYMHI